MDHGIIREYWQLHVREYESDESAVRAIVKKHGLTVDKVRNITKVPRVYLGMLRYAKDTEGLTGHDATKLACELTADATRLSMTKVAKIIKQASQPIDDASQFLNDAGS